jgi:hypothetical protein
MSPRVKQSNLVGQVVIHVRPTATVTGRTVQEHPNLPEIVAEFARRGLIQDAKPVCDNPFHDVSGLRHHIAVGVLSE